MKIAKLKVVVTCELHLITDCEVRKAPLKRLLARKKYKRTSELVAHIVKE
ncbi:hypothetical protein ACWGOQ_0003950 [Aquimarina sp. M1]